MLSTFFPTSLGKTVWKQQLAYIPEGTTLQFKWSFGYYLLWNCMTVTRVQHAKRVSKAFPCPDPPIPPSDVAADTEDCLYHASTSFVDSKIHILTRLQWLSLHLGAISSHSPQTCPSCAALRGVSFPWALPRPHSNTQGAAQRAARLRALLSLQCSQSPLQSWQQGKANIRC